MDSMGGMLTNGLGASACNSLIFGPLKLNCLISLLNYDGGGGGFIPAATIAKQTYQRVDSDDENDEIDERNARLLEKRLVTLSMRFNNTQIQKEYIVSKKRADKVMNTVAFINTTLEKMSASISSIYLKPTE